MKAKTLDTDVLDRGRGGGRLHRRDDRARAGSKRADGGQGQDGTQWRHPSGGALCGNPTDARFLWAVVGSQRDIRRSLRGRAVIPLPSRYRSCSRPPRVRIITGWWIRITCWMRVCGRRNNSRDAREAGRLRSARPRRQTHDTARPNEVRRLQDRDERVPARRVQA